MRSQCGAKGSDDWARCRASVSDLYAAMAARGIKTPGRASQPATTRRDGCPHAGAVFHFVPPKKSRRSDLTVPPAVESGSRRGGGARKDSGTLPAYRFEKDLYDRNLVRALSGHSANSKRVIEALREYIDAIERVPKTLLVCLALTNTVIWNGRR